MSEFRASESQPWAAAPSTELHGSPEEEEARRFSGRDSTPNTPTLTELAKNVPTTEGMRNHFLPLPPARWGPSTPDPSSPAAQISDAPFPQICRSSPISRELRPVLNGPLASIATEAHEFHLQEFPDPPLCSSRNPALPRVRPHLTTPSSSPTMHTPGCGHSQPSRTQVRPWACSVALPRIASPPPQPLAHSRWSSPGLGPPRSQHSAPATLNPSQSPQGAQRTRKGRCAPVLPTGLRIRDPGVPERDKACPLLHDLLLRR